MNVYNWYLIFNKQEFINTGLISRTLTLELEDIGTKEVLITNGNTIGITYEGIFLPIKLNDKNPYEMDNMAVYENATGNVYLGFLVPDET